MFPGENSFEMIKNGKNILVTKKNFNQFINVSLHFFMQISLYKNFIKLNFYSWYAIGD